MQSIVAQIRTPSVLEGRSNALRRNEINSKTFLKDSLINDLDGFEIWIGGAFEDAAASADFG